MHHLATMHSITEYRQTDDIMMHIANHTARTSKYNQLIKSN